MINKYLVVGCGFTGAVLSERIASQLGEPVLVIDRRNHIGGNAYDYAGDHGIVIHRYGPHIFHTNAPRIAEYLSQFTSWRPYEHRVRGFVDGIFVPLPFNFTSMEMVFGKSKGTQINKLLADEFGTEVKVPILKMRDCSSKDVRRIADFIYEKVFLYYNIKQWGMRPEDLDPSVSARVPVHLSSDDRYFQDSFQFMPADGYLSIFKRMLDHPLIEVRTNVSFTEIESSEKYDHVIFTGPIDEFFDYCHGPLPYRSLRFENHTVASAGPIQSAAQENYPTPADQHAYTRSTEYQLLTGQSGVGYTTRAFEFPESYEPGQNEPFYPVPREDNRAIFRKYDKEARRLSSVTFAGRLADYNYYNMDQAIARALSCFENDIVPAAKRLRGN